MTQHGDPARGDWADGPYSDARISQVRITSIADAAPDDRALRHRLAPSRVRRSAIVIAGLAAALATVGAMVIEAGPSHRTEQARAGHGAHPNGAGWAGAGLAGQYPFRCLSVTRYAADRSYARTEFDRASPCWRYSAFVVAVFHHVQGTWRMVLDTTSYSCPVTSLQGAVKAQLGVCPRPAAPSSYPSLRIRQIDTPFSEAP